MATLEISKLEELEYDTVNRLYKDIKDKIKDKESLELVENPFKKIDSHFIFQPFGSQDFPDFLIFTKKFIFPIEIKFTTNKKSKDLNLDSQKPMWNSNLPKPNSIYLFGVSGQNITFFLGSDILDSNTREILNGFFRELDNPKDKLEYSLQELKNNFGLYPYIRKAFDHKANKSTYKNSLNKQVVESYFSENLDKREENVLKFLEENS